MLIANPFVYEKTYSADVKSATIPSLLAPYYGQCGEDLIVSSIIQALELQGYINLSDHVVVEIGANHPFAGSNSYLIYQHMNIPSVLVEANAALIPDLMKARSESTIVHAAIVTNNENFVEFYVSNHHEISSLNKDFIDKWHDGQVGIKESVQVPALRVNKLFEKYILKNNKILFLSIDVEGLDLEIAKDIDYSVWRPLFIQLEPSEHYSSGESKNMIEFMREKEYLLLVATHVNLIFIDKNVLRDLISKDI